MVICEKCGRLCDCKEGQMFLELKKTMNFSLPECWVYEEKEEKPDFKIIKGGNNNEKTIYIFANGWKI